jgi:two-component system LytT family sensor kinase
VRPQAATVPASVSDDWHEHVTNGSVHLLRRDTPATILILPMKSEPTMTDTRRALSRAAAIFAAWTASGLLTASQTRLQLIVRGQTQPTWSVFGPAMIGAWIWALYTPVVVRLARRLRPLRERTGPLWSVWPGFLGAHLLVSGVLVAVDTVVWTFVRPLIDGVTPPLSRVFAATLSYNVAAYLAVVTITEAVDYAARWRERERAAAELADAARTLEQRLDEARLRALEGQLQPHFLYNTLNMVAELVHDEPDTADDMLINLGALLRRSCRESPHVVPLKEEISFVRGYAEILARRYRDRVTLAIDVPVVLEQHLVPAFMLQPLVENAFRHGVEQREAASFVGITVTARDNTLVVRVRDRAMSDTGRPSIGELVAAAGDVDFPSTASDGIGLRNIRERLAMLYGNVAGVTLVHARGETIAAVWLPLDPAIKAHPAKLTDLELLVRPMHTGAGA